MDFLFSSGPRTPRATILLPNVLWPAVYGSAQRLVNASDCIGLHPRQDVGIEVERDSNLLAPSVRSPPWDERRWIVDASHGHGAGRESECGAGRSWTACVPSR